MLSVNVKLFYERSYITVDIITNGIIGINKADINLYLKERSYISTDFSEHIRLASGVLHDKQAIIIRHYSR